MVDKKLMIREAIDLIVNARRDLTEEPAVQTPKARLCARGASAFGGEPGPWPSLAKGHKPFGFTSEG